MSPLGNFVWTTCSVESVLHLAPEVTIASNISSFSGTACFVRDTNCTPAIKYLCGVVTG